MPPKKITPNKHFYILCLFALLAIEAVVGRVVEW